MDNMTPESRDDLEIGQDMIDDRELVAYTEALEAADAAGEPLFTFTEFLARVEASQRLEASLAPTLPPPADDNLPF